MKSSTQDDQPTTLWTLRQDQRVIRCDVRLETYGIDVTILGDGAAVVTRTFETDTETLAWADRKRAGYEAEGWTSVLSRPIVNKGPRVLP